MPWLIVVSNTYSLYYLFILFIRTSAACSSSCTTLRISCEYTMYTCIRSMVTHMIYLLIFIIITVSSVRGTLTIGYYNAYFYCRIWHRCRINLLVTVLIGKEWSTLIVCIIMLLYIHMYILYIRTSSNEMEKYSGCIFFSPLSFCAALFFFFSG